MTTLYNWLPLALVVVAALLAIRWLGPGWWLWRGGDGSGPSGDGDSD
jgi:hypothetical protein